jgi:cell division protein FtsB
MEAVYIIHLREFINAGQSVYKIGRTSQPYIKRASSYPKGSDLKFQMSVINSHKVETQIIRIFEQEFIRRRDFGSEYFEGNIDDMGQRLLDIAKQCNKDEHKEINDLKDEINELKEEIHELKNIKMREIGDKFQEDIQRITRAKLMSSKSNVADDASVDAPTIGKANRTCNVCKKKFGTNANYNFHINRQIPCLSPELMANIPPLIKNFKCDRCNACFQTNYKLTAHLNRKFTCVPKHTSEDIPINLLAQLHQHQMKIQQLENQLHQ